MLDVVLVKAANVTGRHASVVPPLGAPALASWFEQRTSAACGVIDTQVEALDRGLSRLGCDASPPRLFGVSALTWERASLASIVAALHARFPGVPLVVGGSHASSYPEAVLELPGVDWVVEREGEVVLEQKLDVLSAGGVAEDIPGVSWRRPGGDVVRNERPAYIEEQDALPLIDFTKIDLRRHRRHESYGMGAP